MARTGSQVARHRPAKPIIAGFDSRPVLQETRWSFGPSGRAKKVVPSRRQARVHTSANDFHGQCGARISNQPSVCVFSLLVACQRPTNCISTSLIEIIVKAVR